MDAYFLKITDFISIDLVQKSCVLTVQHSIDPTTDIQQYTQLNTALQ